MNSHVARKEQEETLLYDYSHGNVGGIGLNGMGHAGMSSPDNMMRMGTRDSFEEPMNVFSVPS
jgi:hypothetical protein